MTKFVAQKVVPLSVVLMKNKGTTRSLFKNVKIFFTSPWSLGVRVPWSVCKGEGMNTRFGRREKEVSTRSGKRKWVKCLFELKCQCKDETNWTFLCKFSTHTHTNFNERYKLEFQHKR